MIHYWGKTISNVWLRRVLLCVISVVYIVNSFDQTRINSLSSNNELKTILSENKITIVQSDGAWQIASLFPYMNDNVKYNITNKIDYQNYRANEVVAIDNKILIDKEKISSFQLLYSQTFFDFYRVK